MEPPATEDSEIVYHHDVRVVAALAMSLLMKMTCYFEGDTLKPFFDRLLSVGLI